MSNWSKLEHLSKKRDIKNKKYEMAREVIFLDKSKFIDFGDLLWKNSDIRILHIPNVSFTELALAAECDDRAYFFSGTNGSYVVAMPDDFLNYRFEDELNEQFKRDEEYFMERESYIDEMRDRGELTDDYSESDYDEENNYYNEPRFEVDENSIWFSTENLCKYLKCNCMVGQINEYGDFESIGEPVTFVLSPVIKNRGENVEKISK